MAVENGACFVGYRFRHVVAFHQNRVQGGDGTLLRLARPFHELRQGGKYRGRESSAGRRLAGSEADLPLRPREAGHRVHHQQHLGALVPEILGDGGGHIGRLEPFHGRTLRGRDHDDGLLESFLPDVVLDELAHLAPPLADEGQDLDVRRGIADQHGQQCALAAPGRREDAHPLPFAAGQQAVENAQGPPRGSGVSITLRRMGSGGSERTG